VDALTIEMAEMLTITGPKVGAVGAYGARQNWDVLLGQPFRSLVGHFKRPRDLDPAAKPIQA
jgi:hypothetical protein